MAEVRAAGLLVFRVVGEFQYLLLQASNGMHHWTPPKGHVDPGEDLRETAIRETEEEAGLSSSKLDIIEDFSIVLKYPARGKPKRVDYWLAQLKDPNTTIKLSHEHQDFKWVNVTTALKMIHSNMASDIVRAEEFLQNKFPKSSNPTQPV